MKKLTFLSVILAFLAMALTPAMAQKGKDSKAKTAMKSPKIPIPTGDVRKKAPSAGDAPKIQIGKAETFKLDNGLTVILVENHKLPKADFRVFVDYDPVMEKEAAGFLDMMGSLLSKGTTTKKKEQIDIDVDFLGAYLSSDANGLSGGCLSKHSDKLLAVMSDVLLNPTFPDEEFAKDKKRSESGLASKKDDAGQIAGDISALLNYGKNHPYGEFMTEQSLAKINTDLMKKHYNTFFKPNIAYFVITGDATRVQAEQWAKKYFGSWKKGDVPKSNYAMPSAPAKRQVDFVAKPGAVQSVVNITYPVDLKPGTPDVIKARVANAVFGGYFNSRINANLREGHGWTYGARSSLNPDILVGSFKASASVRNVVSDSVVVELLKEMERMRTEKVPQTELQVVKNVLAGQFSQSLEEPGTVANFALNTARYKLPADYYEKYLENLAAVTADDVLEMSKKYIRPDNAHVLVVGNKAEVADKLKTFSPDGKVNMYDADGNEVKDMSGSVPKDMTADKVIQDYINAVGGKANIEKIKDLQGNAAMALGPGQEIKVKMSQKGGNKLSIVMTMMGQEVSKQLYDGQKGAAVQMGQTQELEGESLNDLKEQAAICKEIGYLSMGHKLNLTGMENIKGADAYVLEITRPDGKKTTEYYDVKTGYKVREVSSSPGPDGNPAVTTIDLSDYKEVGNGVKIAHTLSISGMLPMPVKMIFSDFKVNGGIDDAVFKF